MDALIEFIKILVPASVVLYAAYLLVRTFIQKEIELKKLEVRSRSIETVLPNRLQAYEINGIPVYVDKKHTMYIIGKEVDFYDGEAGRGFMFVDPRQSASVVEDQQPA